MKGTTNAQPDTSGFATTAAVAAKQDKLTAGAGISISGSTIGLSNAGSAGTVGSATAVPVITTDAYGRVTSKSTVTIYPPTTAGTTGQVWTSDGSGAGSWQDPSSGGGETWEDLSLDDLVNANTSNFSVNDRLKIEISPNFSLGCTFEVDTEYASACMYNWLLTYSQISRSIGNIIEVSIKNTNTSYSSQGIRIGNIINSGYGAVGNLWLCMNKLTSSTSPLFYLYGSMPMTIISVTSDPICLTWPTYGVINMDLTNDTTAFDSSNYKFTAININDVITRAWILRA